MLAADNSLELLRPELCFLYLEKKKLYCLLPKHDLSLLLISPLHPVIGFSWKMNPSVLLFLKISLRSFFETMAKLMLTWIKIIR
jgi:hypothetical protein